MVHPPDRTADCAAVFGKLHEQYTECEYYCGLPDWNRDDIDCGQFAEGTEGFQL